MMPEQESIVDELLAAASTAHLRCPLEPKRKAELDALIALFDDRDRLKRIVDAMKTHGVYAIRSEWHGDVRWRARMPNGCDISPRWMPLHESTFPTLEEAISAAVLAVTEEAGA